MNEQDRQRYQEEYRQAKEKGVPFFPDILFKDAVVALVVFGLLIGLAYFLGAPLEPRADPADTSYTPRPEWYFLPIFQLLKYFPGNLEVIGVFVIPTLGVLILFALPLIDRGPKRHFLSRPVITAGALVVVAAGVVLGFLAAAEAPPPREVVAGDEVAALYTQNCASCHGPRIAVPIGTDLHSIIAQGSHEGMPAWSADLSTDQIDALAGFILSPAGSQLFVDSCGACHQAVELVAGDPSELRNALEQGPAFPAHAGVVVPDWSVALSPERQIALLNFLVAPDGQRLFEVNCATCHGRAAPFAGDEVELRQIIAEGGLHLEMPAWRGRLSDPDLDTLAAYVVDPGASPQGSDLFSQNCAACHGERIPMAPDLTAARILIASGGAHETMPVWGEILTAEQIDALTRHALDAAQGAPVEVGRELYAANCAACHGQLGEGGPNPARPGDIIAPISSREYLTTRDDHTLRLIIAQGQPDFGMSPFGASFGGPLDDEQIEALVAFMRAWEVDPPVEAPPEVAAAAAPLPAARVFSEVCARCHGPAGEGVFGPPLRGPEFQNRYTDQEIFNTISLGHEATPMIAWGEILTSQQIHELVQVIRALDAAPREVGGEAPSFSADVAPILAARCAACHGNLGGWDASSYSAVMTSGDHAPVILPGDVEDSLLATLIQGLQAEGQPMPPGGLMPPGEIQIILDWIASGAPDN